MLTILENIRRMNRRCNRKRGSAIIMVMMTMAVIFTVGTSMVHVTLSSFSTSLAETGKEKAYASATAVAGTIKDGGKFHEILNDNIVKNVDKLTDSAGNYQTGKDFRITFADGNDYIMVNGARVEVSISLEGKKSPGSGQPPAPSKIRVDVKSRYRSQESTVSFYANNNANPKQNLLDLYGNSVVMAGSIGGEDKNPFLVLRRIEGDVSIDCRFEPTDTRDENGLKQIVTRYFNPTVLQGVTGSVFANGDLVVGGADNIVKVRGNLYVDGNLTIRGLDLGCDLPGVWRKDFHKEYANYHTVANKRFGSIELMGTDNKVSHRMGKGVVGDGMYGMVNGVYRPLQVYYEVSHQYLLERNITKFWTRKYNTSGGITWSGWCDITKDELGRPAEGEPQDRFYGAVMYTDSSCTEMYDMFPKGGNIFCTGDIVVDRCNVGDVCWTKKDHPTLFSSGESGPHYFKEVNPDGTLKSVVPNQSIVHGDVYCLGRMIVAPTNLFMYGGNVDWHTGRHFVDGYIDTESKPGGLHADRAVSRKTSNWKYYGNSFKNSTANFPTASTRFRFAVYNGDKSENCDFRTTPRLWTTTTWGSKRVETRGTFEPPASFRTRYISAYNTRRNKLQTDLKNRMASYSGSSLDGIRYGSTLTSPARIIQFGEKSGTSIVSGGNLYIRNYDVAAFGVTDFRKKRNRAYSSDPGYINSSGEYIQSSWNVPFNGNQVPVPGGAVVLTPAPFDGTTAGKPTVVYDNISGVGTNGDSIPSRGVEYYYGALTVKLASIKAKEIYASGPINVIDSFVPGYSITGAVQADRICNDGDDADRICGRFQSMALLDIIKIVRPMNAGETTTAYNTRLDNEFFVGKSMTYDSYFSVLDVTNRNATSRPETGAGPNVFTGLVLGSKNSGNDPIAFVYTEKSGDNNAGDTEGQISAGDGMNSPHCKEVQQKIKNNIAAYGAAKCNAFDLTDPVFLNEPKGQTNYLFAYTGDSYYNTITLQITAADIKADANSRLKFARLISNKYAGTKENFYAFSGTVPSLISVTGSFLPAENIPLKLGTQPFFVEPHDPNVFGMYLRKTLTSYKSRVNRTDGNGNYPATVKEVFEEMFDEKFAYVPAFKLEPLPGVDMDAKMAEALLPENRDNSDYDKYRSRHKDGHGNWMPLRIYNDFDIISGASGKETDNPSRYRYNSSLNPLYKILSYADLAFNVNFGCLTYGGLTQNGEWKYWNHDKVGRYFLGNWIHESWNAGKVFAGDCGFFNDPVYVFKCPPNSRKNNDPVNSGKKVQVQGPPVYLYYNWNATNLAGSEDGGRAYCYMRGPGWSNVNDVWCLIVEKNDKDDTVRVMSFYKNNNGVRDTTVPRILPANKYQIDPYDPAGWLLPGLKTPRTQLEYNIKDNVYFDFSGRTGGYDTATSVDGGVVFGASFEGAKNLLGTSRMKITLDTHDSDVYVYINAPDPAEAHQKYGSAAGLFLKKVTWQVDGLHNAYIMLVGDTKMDANAFALEVENTLDNPGDVSDEAVGTHFISDWYPIFDYGFQPYSESFTEKLRVKATPRIDPVTGKQATGKCGTLYIVGTGKNELKIGRGGFVNGVVMMPEGKYVNRSRGLAGFLPAIGTSSSKPATIMAKEISIEGSNAGQLTWEAYGAGKPEQSVNPVDLEFEDGSLEMVAGEWEFGGYV